MTMERSIVVGFSAFPPRRRRFPDAPRPPHRRGRSRVVAAASCRRSGCRRAPVHPGVVSAPPSPAVARAARPPSSRLSPLRRRVIAAASSSSRPKPTVERSSVAAERPLAVARRPRLVARPPATRRPCVVATPSSPPRRRRSLSSSSSSPPSSLPSPSSSPPSSSTLSVTGRAAVVVVRVGSSPFSGASVAGCHRLVVTVVRRPSPRQPPCRRHRGPGTGMLHVVVVVVGS